MILGVLALFASKSVGGLLLLLHIMVCAMSNNVLILYGH